LMGSKRLNWALPRALWARPWARPRPDRRELWQMKKPTNRKPRKIGDVMLKEVHYHRTGLKVTRDEYRVEATWKEGRNKRKKQWFNNWRVAEEFAEAQNKALAEIKGRKSFTFREAADGWMKQQDMRTRAKDRTLEPQTFIRYRLCLERAVDRFGNMQLHTIRARHVADWLEELSEDYARSSLPAYRGVVNRVLFYAQRQEMLMINPLIADPVKIAGSVRKRADIPDRSDMEKIRDAILGARPFNIPRQTWDYTRIAIAIAATCGLRISEVCGLRWDSIDRDTGEITVKDVIVCSPGARVKPYPKGGPDAIRKVPTDSYLRDLLNEYSVTYAERFGSCIGHVIRSDRVRCDGSKPNPGFIRPTSLERFISRFMQHAGVVRADGGARIEFHSLRHFCASHWMKATGGDIHLVAKWLGHKQASTTLNVYGHCLDDAEGRAKFEAMPSWLAPALAIETPARRAAAVPVPQPVAALPPPIECPIKVAEWAERWLHAFVAELWASGGDMRRALAPTGKTGTQVRYELRRCGLPTVDELREMAAAAHAGEVPVAPVPIEPDQAPCPIELPPGAAGWRPAYFRELEAGALHQVACRMIHKNPPEVTAELKRLKLPDAAHAGNPKELRRRLRHKKMLALIAAGYQDVDVARRCGLRDRHTVMKFRQELLKTAADKPLKNKGKLPLRIRPDARPEHKNQFKFL
jgi:integrase